MKIFISLFLILALVACNKNDASNAPKSTTASNESTSKKDIEDRLEDLELEKLFRSLERVAYLKIGGDGYTPVAFDLGVLTVKIKDVQPYANSSKILLEIGNPLGATITGLKATIQWGSTNEKGYPLEELGSKEVVIDKNIIAGSWNSISITLDAADPKKLGFIRVKNVSHTGIILSKAR